MKLERGKLRRQGVLLYLAAFSMIVVLIIAIMGGYLYRFYHRTIYEKDTGFCRLLKYLSGTVSVDKKIIDIMTPNYDRIIEIICDMKMIWRLFLMSCHRLIFQQIVLNLCLISSH